MSYKAVKDVEVAAGEMVGVLRGLRIQLERGHEHVDDAIDVLKAQARHPGARDAHRLGGGQRGRVEALGVLE